MLISECVEEGAPIQTNKLIGHPYLVERLVLGIISGVIGSKV